VLNRWATVVLRAPRIVALVAATAVVAAGLGGIGVVNRLGDGAEFYDKGSESWTALQRNFEQGGPWTVPNLLVAVDRPTDQRLSEVRTALNDPGVLIALDSIAFKIGSAKDNTRTQAPLANADGSMMAIAVYLNGQGASAADLAEALRAIAGVRVGGADLARDERSGTIGADLLRAEMIAFPLLFILSLLLFRSLVGALLPVVTGASSIAVTMLGINIAAGQTMLSEYVLNVVTGLSLGLAIDYSLLMLWRHREEVAEHGYGEDALRSTLATAGRTIALSALTVAAALACLAVFPIGFLRSIGIAGAVTAVTAGAMALIVLPVLLTLLGSRVESLTPVRWRNSTQVRADRTTTGSWYRVAHFAMRRPAVTVVATSVLLILLAWPAASITLGSLNSADVPKGSEVGSVARQLTRELPVDIEEPVIAIVAGQSEAQTAAFIKRVAAAPGVAAVLQPNELPGGDTRIDIFLNRGADTAEFVRAARNISAPGQVLIGGSSVAFADQRSAILDRLPIAICLMSAAILVLLFLLTGSVLLPVKALLMTALTVAAALGVMVYIFQYGRFEAVLGYASTGSFDLTVPVLVVAFGVGLSTDYGIFLLTRIRESRIETDGDEREAVALGLDRTGRIVSAAALLFCVAFGAFALARLALIKEIGIGTAAAVAIDVTLVRALLVPSLMALLGRWNWWAPGPLRTLHNKIGVWRPE
jgi:RND superfamily putative drug exporter